MSKNKKVFFPVKNDSNSSITTLECTRYWWGTGYMSFQVTQNVVDVFAETGATANLIYVGKITYCIRIVHPVRYLPGMYSHSWVFVSKNVDRFLIQLLLIE